MITQPTIWLTLILSIPAALWLSPPPLQAQSTAPTAQDCRVAANKLASNPRSEAHRLALATGRLSECGDIGAKALAAALREYQADTDLHLLQQLTLAASLNRHPDIWRAALDVAMRRNTSVPVRVASFQILLRQHDVGTSLEGEFPRLSSERMGQFCRVDVVPHARYLSLSPLPVDYRQRIEVATSRIAADPAEPPVIRDLARCVGNAVRGFGDWEEEPDHL